MSNVVSFPKGKRNSPPQTLDEIVEQVELVRKEHIEVVIDDALAFVFSRLYEDGFDLGREECIKTTSMLIETLRSTMYMSVNLSHPLHDLAERMYNITPEGEVEDSDEVIVDL
jgi:hypothetical protein